MHLLKNNRVLSWRRNTEKKRRKKKNYKGKRKRGKRDIEDKTRIAKLHSNSKK